MIFLRFVFSLPFLSSLQELRAYQADIATVLRNGKSNFQMNNDMIAIASNAII